MYAVAQVDAPETTTSPPVRLLGLSSDRSYRVRFALPVPEGARADTPSITAMSGANGIILAGSALSSIGLQLPALWPRSAVLLHVQAVD